MVSQCVCVFPGSLIPIIDFVLAFRWGYIEFQRLFLGKWKKFPPINHAHCQFARPTRVCPLLQASGFWFSDPFYLHGRRLRRRHLVAACGTLKAAIQSARTKDPPPYCSLRNPHSTLHWKMQPWQLNALHLCLKHVRPSRQHSNRRRKKRLPGGTFPTRLLNDS